MPRIAAAQDRQFDCLFKNGLVIDGTGSPGTRQDVAIRGDRIEALGSFPDSAAAEVVDLDGATLCPGFIDVHAHTNLLRNNGAESKLFQGVTLDITGPDGGSDFPYRKPGSPETISDVGQSSSLDAWARKHDEHGLPMNLGSYVGHATVRELVLGSEQRAPSQSELKTMKDLVREGMEQGAVGLSSGLEYNPAGFAETDEIIALAKVAAEFGGVYGTHVRNEDQFVIEAVEEAIEICRKSGARLLLTHLKVAGTPNWDKFERILEMIEQARDEGLDVSADRYPYLAWSTGLSIFFPGWSKEGGTFRDRLKDSDTRDRMKEETITNIVANGGWGTLMLTGGLGESFRNLMGKRIDEAAEEAGLDPYEFTCELLTENNVSIVGFGMSDENTDRIVSLPYCMISSDGSAMTARPNALGHPRSFGSFPRAIRQYVFEKRLMSLHELIRKMTSLPSDTMNIADRGRIKTGKIADLVVFRPEAFKDRATYLKPQQYSEGVDHLLCNGTFVIKNGTLTGQRPGQIVRSTQ
jgi:N-acyl-D-amino-acid deacylase